MGKRKKRNHSRRSGFGQSIQSQSTYGNSSFGRTTQNGSLPQESKSPAGISVSVAWIGFGATVIAALLLVGYNVWSTRPALSANIIISSFGDSRSFGRNDKHWSVALYVALTNDRDVPVSPANYQLNVKSHGISVPMVLDYVDTLEMDFIDGAPLGIPGPATASFPSKRSLLTYEMTEPVTKAKPRYGLLWFRSVRQMDAPLQPGTISDYELVVIDSADKRYYASVTDAPDFKVLYSYEPTMIVRPMQLPPVAPQADKQTSTSLPPKK